MPALPPIPFRLAARILADCLGGQARHLSSLTPGRSAGRRGVYAADGSAAKLAGRRANAERMRGQAAQLSGMAGDPSSSHRPAIDAGLLACLVAASYGHGEAWRPIEARTGPLDGPAKGDVISVLIELTRAS
jgi:hypothetical protein